MARVHFITHATVAMTTLVLLMTSRSTHGCSEPEGWTEMPYNTRAEEAGVVIIGTFGAPRNHTQDGREYLAVTTTVECVLRNKAGVELGGSVDVLQDEPNPRCTSSFHLVREGERNVVFLHEDSPGVVMFDTVNMEAAIRPYSEDVVGGLMGLCGFQDPVVPSGGNDQQCPAVPQDVDCSPTGGAAMVQGSVHVMSLLVSAVLVCGAWLL